MNYRKLDLVMNHTRGSFLLLSFRNGLEFHNFVLNLVQRSFWEHDQVISLGYFQLR